ncbi:siderophore-interacting protein [Sphingobium jiangsuense]|uniref:NADPH-dependent ferric siderophore reductase n=1 Tax=Sphingobium jiangsuense TaxID=870476 RepID=A0A7W6FQH7_9SPHN|nr:siderophore-interacting protein [Sphingobium jiangsuense]MBB3927146.1 NADPH-dependent ferric siderophore reductase [Sphingobium jiangsuense]GLT00740.1 siderophore-interacting protein [Sphingobium jiangsuense]
MEEERRIIRMRHETRRRTLTVAAREQVTPNLLSIRFTSDELHDFISASADDHVKLFVPDAAREGERPPMRDYTPRSFDADEGEIVIEFALHDDPGPATAWAMAARPGDSIQIGGPRGSVVIPDSYDWYWLIGDETALPSIARRIGEWPYCSIYALVAVTGAEEEIAFERRPGLTVDWAHRPAAAAHDPAALLDRIRDRPFPQGDGFIWIAAEAGVARALRQHVLDRGHPPARMKAAGYWTHGAADTTERFD